MNKSLLEINPLWDSPKIADYYFQHLRNEVAGISLAPVIDSPVLAEVSLLIPTSGSTGNPRLVALHREALLASANLSNQYLNVKPSDRWSLLLPLTHIAGFNVLTRSFVNHSPVVFSATDEAEFSAIVPTQLHSALYGDRDKDHALLNHLKNCKAVLVGGAATGLALLHAAHDAGIHIVTTYGMSEMSGGCVYDGVALPGVKVEISQSHNSSGLITLSGPTLAMGYYNSSSQEIDPFPNGVFRTSDLGVIHNGKLEVLGRADEVINSGGEKISLIALENFLSEMFIGVQFCAVGLPDAKWGEVLMLAYSTPTHFSIETGDISRAIEEEFETYYLPKSIKKVESLPTLGIGKIDRKAVRQLFL